MAIEECGRYSLELSLSETLIRSLSRSVTSSLDPFTFRPDAIAKDVAVLFATLAKVTAEQMSTSARLYSQAVFWRRESLLTGSRLK